MDAIRIWAAAVCAAAIAASAAQLAAPSGKVQKALGCVIGLFFVCSVIAPFAKELPQLAEDLSGPRQDGAAFYGEELAEEIHRQTLEAFSRNIQSAAEDILAKADIFPEEIRPGVHFTEDSRIDISSLTITLKKEDALAKEQAVSLLRQGLGVQPEVFIEGEE